VPLKNQFLIESGTTGRLENIERIILGFVYLVIQVVLLEQFGWWLDIHRKRQTLICTAPSDDTAISISEGKLLIPLVIVIHNNRIEIM
jgi:hypothetical protein